MKTSILLPLFASLVLQSQELRSEASDPGDLMAELIFQDGQRYKGTKVSFEQVQAVFCKIFAQSEEGITFNPCKLTDSVTDGTCSALSLDFVASYAELRDRWTVQDANFWEGLLRLKAHAFQVREEIISRQIAFNSIEVIKSERKIDYARNKIQSLANYHDFVIDYASPMLDLYTDTFWPELEQTVESLPHGIYLVRVLLPADNEKLEIKGHTVVYCKEEGIGFYYEPNEGLRKFNHSHARSLLYGIRDIYLTYQVHLVRFYRIRPL